MAEIQPSPSGNKRRKLTTPRVDLTPMVDLGFLLITFFMYTTTLAQPRVLELQMPYPPDNAPPPVPAESTIILLPAGQHQVAFYPGTARAAESLDWRGFSGKHSLRELLAAEATRVSNLPSTFSMQAHKLHVLIKPDTSAAYEDIVRTLDEMAIADVPYYAMMRISAEEQAAIQKFSPVIYGK